MTAFDEQPREKVDGEGSIPADTPSTTLSTGCQLTEYADAKKLDVEFLRGLGVTEITVNGAPAICIPYQDADGRVVAERLRVALDGDKKFRWWKGAKQRLYGLHRLKDERAARQITLVEGESDTQTLWQHQIPALGLPGASSWTEERDAPALDGFETVLIVNEPDEGGEAMMRWLAKSRIRDRAKIVRLTPFKDVSELHCHDPTNFRAEWQAAVDNAITWATWQAERAEAGEGHKATGRSATIADRLLALARDAELFHTVDGCGFADVMVNGHRETWRIKSRNNCNFKRWLTKRFYDCTGSAPSAEALQRVLGVVEARAQFEAPERRVYTRVAGDGAKIYLDLGNAEWQAVAIDASGWRVINNPPVRFRRAAGMLPLPAPTRCGSVQTLRPFLNVKDDAAFAVVLAWLHATYRPRGPYPVLALSGEQGSAKSTFSAILRALIDPNSAPLRALPREDRDLFIAATNAHVLCFDNVSGLPTWISDTLCRLATGGGFAVRALYSDGDEVLFDAQRPIILNGIEDVIERPDLADRSIFMRLQPIPDGKRKREADLWREFERDRPAILGALLDQVADGLRRLPTTRLLQEPRMVDFAVWAKACEPSSMSTFETAYAANRSEVVATVVDADLVASSVMRLMADRCEWRGNATELLQLLTNIVGEAISRAKKWPVDGARLSGRLTHAATFLRKSGIEIERLPDGKRTISIHRGAENGA